jgi:hypothetical protein
MNPQTLRGPAEPPTASIEGACPEIAVELGRPTPADDPLANIRERQDRRPGFQDNAELDSKKLI